ncbi:hypothetical protein STEG23_030015 [Scotinomys teguina]
MKSDNTTTPLWLKVTYISMEVVIGLCAVVGNMLVIWVVKLNPSLRTTTFYFIVSLALADIAVGVLVMPLAIAVSLEVEMHFYACLFMSCVLLIFTHASIMSLLAIAIDRYLRVKLSVRKMTSVVSSNNTLLCHFRSVVCLDYMVFFSFITWILIPLIAMCVIYLDIFYILRNKLSQNLSGFRETHPEPLRSSVLRAEVYFLLIMEVFLLLSSALFADAMVMDEKVKPCVELDTVSASCNYDAQYKDHTKYWCQGYFRNWCNIVAFTPNSTNHVALKDTGSQLIITVSCLVKEDTGWYWCGIQRDFARDDMDFTQLIVTDNRDSRVDGFSPGKEADPPGKGNQRCRTSKVIQKAEGSRLYHGACKAFDEHSLGSVLTLFYSDGIPSPSEARGKGTPILTSGEDDGTEWGLMKKVLTLEEGLPLLENLRLFLSVGASMVLISGFLLS